MTGKNTGGVLRLFEMLKVAMVTRRAVRFYEQQGLLTPAGRDRFGRRVYVQSDLMRLLLIRNLRDAGLSVAAVREVLDSRAVRPDDRTPTTWLGRMEAVLAHYSEQLTQQLAAMQRAEQELRQSVAWLTQHHDEVQQIPTEQIGEDEAVPLIIRALLCQPSTLAAVVPPRAPSRRRAPAKEGIGFSPPTW